MKRRRNKSIPNPLFEKWLEEWKENAKKNDLPMQYTYGRALATLRQCPVPLESGKKCMVMPNFGPKICEMLDKRLEEYYRAENNQPQNSGKKVRKIDNENAKARQIDNAKKINEPEKNVARAPRPYIPKARSAPHAILVTLYEESLEPNYPGFMHRINLMTKAQDKCDVSMQSNALQHYAGWSSMSTLIDKNLVKRKSNPAKYSLTDAGLALALSLYESESAQQIDDEQTVNNVDCLPSTSKSKGYKNINKSKIGGSTNSATRASDENDIVDLLDSYDDDMFQQNIEETKTEFSDFYNSNVLDNINVHSDNDSDDDYDKFCQENPEPLINIKTKEQHFLFTNVLESYSFLNKIGSNVDSQNCISMIQNKAEANKVEPEKIPKNSHQKNDSLEETTYEPFFLLANNFDVKLLVDNQETCENEAFSNDVIIFELEKNGIPYEVRHLNVGDFLWIAKCKFTNKELVLPYIIERKRLDDLSSSIMDGRYHEQKFRLEKSGIRNVIYMIENYENIVCGSVPLSFMLQEAANTLIEDDFDVKFTEDHRDSMHYLSIMTRKLINMYKNQELRSCLKKDLQLITQQPDKLVDQKLMEFNEFNESAAKIKTCNVRQMLICQLIQLQDLSIDEAIAITELYPTPKILSEALRQANDTALADIELGPKKQKLGLSLSKTIHQLYTRSDLV